MASLNRTMQNLGLTKAMRVPSLEAAEFVNRLLQEEPAFYKLTGRHTGLVGVHAELWHGWQFKLELPSTGVSAGFDALATNNSPLPFHEGETVQIKGRGHQTMHITYKTSGIDWLMVIAYDLMCDPVSHRAFLIRTSDLVSLAAQFESELGKPALPVRVLENGASVRIEWSTLFTTKSGDVKSKGADTWEARRKRSEMVLKAMYLWTDNEFANDLSKTLGVY